LTQRYAALLKEYRIHTIVADYYAAEWVSSAWSKAGITYLRSEIPKSQIYLEAAPLFARGVVSLPDHRLLLRQLRLLERRTHRSGRDTVDHPRSGNDDYSNAVCGVLTLMSKAAGSGYDLETLMKANDMYDPKADAERELQQLLARGGQRPLWGPQAAGAIPLTQGGYRAATFEERMLLGLDAEAAERNKGRKPANLPPW
jgi:hypothetical protein